MATRQSGSGHFHFTPALVNTRSVLRRCRAIRPAFVLRTLKHSAVLRARCSSRGLSDSSNPLNAIMFPAGSSSLALDEGPPSAHANTKAHRGGDVVIMTNGPGEVCSWVQAAATAIKDASDTDEHAHSNGVFAALAPCPHASGREVSALGKQKAIDGVAAPRQFLWLLLLGRAFFVVRQAAANVVARLMRRKVPAARARRLRQRGVVLFLGGDQMLAILLAWRLRYRCVLYAERAVLWPNLASAYVLRSRAQLAHVPARWRHKCHVSGDLLLALARKRESTAAQSTKRSSPSETIVGVLPGSKRAKLRIGAPFFLSSAASLMSQMSTDGVKPPRFVLPLAPTTTADDLQACLDDTTDDLAKRFGWLIGRARVEMFEADSDDVRERCGSYEHVGHVVADHRDGELVVELWAPSSDSGGVPPFELYASMDLALTTVGTNTAELGALGVPMVVCLPSHAIEDFRGAAGGLLGLLMQLPLGVGAAVARRVNLALLSQSGHLAWPNMWADAAGVTPPVPELVGRVSPEEVAESAASLLVDATARDSVRDALKRLASAQEEDTGEGGTPTQEVVRCVFAQM